MNTTNCFIPPCSAGHPYSMGYPALGNEGVLDRIFGFLDAVSLTRCREVNALWKICSDGAVVWENLCAELWKDKQNHPLELWVKLQTSVVEQVDEDESCRNALEYLHLQLLLTDYDHSNRTALSCLAFVRLSCTKRRAAPLRHVHREEQIRLEKELRDCTCLSTRQSLIHRIEQNIKSSAGGIDENCELFKKSGRLLSWRESYIASIQDSTRCSISHSVSIR